MLMTRFWPSFPGNDGDAECPIAFSDEETAMQAEQDQMWGDLNQLVSHW
jgi:hypothetical protein